MEKLKTYASQFEGNQTALAEALQISRPYLSSLLTGRKSPSLELAARIERVTKGAVPMSCWIPEPEQAA